MVKRINCSFLTGKFLFLQTGNVQLKPTRYLRFTCWVLPTCGHHTKDCWPHGHTNSEPQGGLLVPPVLRHSRRKIIWLGTFLREMFWRMSMKSNYSGNERRETLIIWACVCCLKKITKVALKSLNHLQVKLKTPDIDPFLHSTICSTIGSENDICPMDPVRVHSTKAYIYVYIYTVYTHWKDFRTCWMMCVQTVSMLQGSNVQPTWPPNVIGQPGVCKDWIARDLSHSSSSCDCLCLDNSYCLVK